MARPPDWPARMQEMSEFVGLSDDDRRLIRDSAAIVVGNAVDLTDAVYDRFLEYPEARKYFLLEDGRVDNVRIEANKKTMIRWLMDASAAPTNDGFPRYIAAIGRQHKDIPDHRPPLGPVPSRYVLGTVSFYQTAIADLMCRELAESDQAARTSVAWNKLLMLQLDLLLASYLTDSPG